MKKFYYFLAVISSCVYSSCSDTLLSDVSPPKVEANVSGIVYPLKMKSRSLSSFETNWENQTTVTLKSGLPVILPWAPNSDANLPVQMRDDIKKEDGWVFLLHTLGDNASTVNNNTNYMLFYNQRTSVLKVFYYLENVVTNNYGFWMIDLGTLNHQFFNHSNDLAVPMDVNYINYWQCNNASSIFDLAFREGWNGFQVQLAYDTTNDIENVELDIKTRNANISIHDLYGDFSGKIQGSIVSHGSVNPFQGIISDIASVFGNTATDYIKEEFNDTITSSRTILESLVSGIGGAIVKDGINKLFTNLTAGFSKPTTNISDITLTTKITGNLKGTSQFNGSAPIMTYSAPFSTSDLGINLGVWNLASAPTIYLHPLADRTSEYFNGKEYNYKMRGITG